MGRIISADRPSVRSLTRTTGEVSARPKCTVVGHFTASCSGRGRLSSGELVLRGTLANESALSSALDESVVSGAAAPALDCANQRQRSSTGLLFCMQGVVFLISERPVTVAAAAV